MTDWKQIGGQVIATGAPILGKIIGEFIPFPGGGMLAEWGIRKLAEALGVPPEDASPSTLGNALQNTPPDVVKAKLAATETEAEARWQAVAEIAKAHAEQNTASGLAINQTMREENAKGPSWWHWRHLIGYLVIAYGVQQLAILTVAAFFPKVISPTDAAALFNATTVFTGGLFALLGYVAADTTALKVAAVTGQPAPTLSGAIIDAVKPRKKQP